MENKEIFNKIQEIIKNSKEVVITTHINPDGDGIGSGLALLLGLNKYIEKNKLDRTIIRFITEDKIPDNLKFLFGIETIESVKNYKKNLKLNSVLISVDTASKERMGAVGDFFENIINIDHHISNTNYGTVNYVDWESASTAEIIYELLEYLNIELDINIGEGLYTGIVNDTGNFKHRNVTKSTMLKAASLIGLGVNNNKILTEFYENKELSTIRIYGRALERAKEIMGKKLIYSYITKKDIEELGGNKYSTEGISEFLAQCNTSEISLFLREDKNGIIKGSMRTKCDRYDLNDVVKVFNGGGHKKAAGFTSNLSIEETVNKIIENI